MRKAAAILSLMLVLGHGLSLSAQDYRASWIASPATDSTSHEWFRQTYLANGRPHNAFLRVATTGFVKIYVNEYNVGTAPFYPAREPHDDSAIALTFDITPYMRPDTNVVAIIYSPSYAHLNSRQVAVTMWGHDAKGQPFCENSDASWLCKKANSAISSDGGEIIDGRKHDTSWRAAAFDLALWRSVEAVSDTAPRGADASIGLPMIEKVIRRRAPYYFDLTTEGVEYEFGTGFRGWVRLTLREAVHGEHIDYGKVHYICNGLLDEQAYPEFYIDTHRRVRITGDKHFKREQITDIEGIETATIKHSENDR